MQYRCKSCKETFDVPDGDRPRCPKCLRIHDVVSAQRSKKSSTFDRYRGPILLFGFVAIGVGAYAAWYLSQGEEEGDDNEPLPVEVGPLSADKLRSHLERRDVKQGEINQPFASSEKIEDFAREAIHGKAEPREKAQATMDAIRDLLDEDHELYVSISPRVEEPRSPAETLEALRAEEPFEPYSYELAALMVTALRSVGVPAVLAEVYQFESTSRPADPSGTLGSYVAAIPRGDGGSYRRPLLYDPASGRSGESAAADSVVLNDVEAVSARLILEGLHAAAHAGDTAEGERLTSLAVRLRSGSATAHAARGTVRLLGGGGQLSGQAALEEYERALRLRPDAQRKILVARILLALGQPARAEELVRSALDDAPEFAAAHGLMGLLYTARESFDEAAAALTRAEQLEPRDPHISMLWVQYHMAQRDLAAAADAAQAVVDRVPDDPQPRLMLAQVLWQDARYDAAREQFRELSRRHPNNEHLLQALSELFGYDPDDDLAESEAVAEAGDAGILGDAGLAGLTSGDAGWSPAASSAGGFQLKMGKSFGDNLSLGGQGGFKLDPGL